MGEQIKSVVDESAFQEVDRLNKLLSITHNLTKNEALLRLECLKLAVTGERGCQVVGIANSYFDFVMKGTVPEVG